MDNSRQLFQCAPPNRAAAVKEKGHRIARWEVRLSSRAPTAGAREGGVRGIPECRCAESDGWECGRDAYMKTRKTASRTGTRLGSGWIETTWTTRDNSFKVPGGQLRSAKEGGRECGRNARRKKRQTGQRGAPCGRTFAGKTDRSPEDKERGRETEGCLTAETQRG